MPVSDEQSGDLAVLLKGFDVEITVGIHEEEGAESHGAYSNAEIGAVHEFGLGVPKRSFVRGYFDDSEAEIEQMTADGLASVLDGADPLTEAALVGIQIEGGMKQRILARLSPELAPSTRKRRGEDAVPLVHTSQLLGSIHSKVK